MTRWKFWRLPVLVLLVGVLTGVAATGRLTALLPDSGDEQTVAGGIEKKAPDKAPPPGSPAATQSPKSKYLPFPKFPEVKF
ncbi:MAG TPA: hypothetical protein VKE98_13145, partial [Gemmataceae bacterium]|nr:hypothetical protein [Gemmataceae bacterium]